MSERYLEPIGYVTISSHDNLIPLDLHVSRDQEGTLYIRRMSGLEWSKRPHHMVMPITPYKAEPIDTHYVGGPNEEAADVG